MMRNYHLLVISLSRDTLNYANANKILAKWMSLAMNVQVHHRHGAPKQSMYCVVDCKVSHRSVNNTQQMNAMFSPWGGGGELHCATDMKVHKCKVPGAKHSAYGSISESASWHCPRRKDIQACRWPVNWSSVHVMHIKLLVQPSRKHSLGTGWVRVDALVYTSADWNWTRPSELTDVWETLPSCQWFLGVV